MAFIMRIFTCSYILSTKLFASYSRTGLLMEVVFKEQGRPCSDLQGLESRVLYSRANDRHKNMGSPGDSGAEGASGVVGSPASA